MIDALPQKVFCRDLEGKIVFANNAFVKETRRQLEEIIGKRDSDLLAPELARKCAADERKARETRLPQESMLAADKAGPRDCYIRLMTMPVYDARGQMFGTQTMYWNRNET